VVCLLRIDGGMVLVLLRFFEVDWVCLLFDTMADELAT
jgi:hypothetical protein